MSGARHGNYVQLKDIVLEKDNDYRVLKMFSNAAKKRETELDSMITKINKAGVRLRVEKRKTNSLGNVTLSPTAHS